MFDFFEPTNPFAAQTLRLVAESQQGGGDVFDIARCAKRIELGNKESWEREWVALAELTERDPEASILWHKVNGTQLSVGGGGSIMPVAYPIPFSPTSPPASRGTRW